MAVARCHKPRKKSYQEIPEHLAAVVLSRDFLSPKTTPDQASRKALDRLRRQYISHRSWSSSFNFSHSPAGSPLDSDVENAGKDLRWAGLHDDCRKLGFETEEDKGRTHEEAGARNTDRGTARAKYRRESILHSPLGAKEKKVGEMTNPIM